MALILKNEYEKKTYSESELHSYASRDFVIGYLGCELNFGFPEPNSNDIYNDVEDGRMSGGFVSVSGNATYYSNLQKALYRFKGFNSRKIGLVLGQNDDNSLVVALLGSDTFKIHDGDKTKIIYRYYWNNSRVNDAGDGRYPFPASATWEQLSDVKSPDTNVNKIAISRFINSSFITIDDAFNDVPNWNLTPSSGVVVPTFFGETCEYNGVYIGGNSGNTNYTLTDNKNTTFVIGDGVVCEYFHCDSEIAKLGHNRYEGMAGDLYSIMYDYAGWFSGRARQRGHEAYEFYPDHIGSFDLTDYVGPFHGGTYACQWIPYNLILTENETEAKEYLRSGRIPSDAWIYPWDPDEFPTTSPVNPDDGGDVPDSDDGDPDDKKPTLDIDDMPPETPETTAQSLNPNNLYWLQKGQLATFFNWFWLDAGTIIDAGDLWDKIKGLYNDLASAIINVRFMPVRTEWIGGTSPATNIIVGQIECPMQSVETINRTTATVQNIGSFNLHDYMKKNFIDFSPHTEVSLYLPYHGYIALDNDLLAECEKLNVKAVYDVTSGTLQYMIYAEHSGHISLINSCIAKIAVDIPVTLQSKNDRDSAIFNNVMNATAGLMSAGVSLAMKNPVGVALSLGNTLGGGTQSAQLSVKGTTGESGAYFMPQRCAIFIKKSFYKLPSKYGLHIGYPCFKSYQLNSKALSGQMVKIHNPYITFNGNLFENGDNKGTFRPLESEIQEIYEQLEKGVII